MGMADRTARHDEATRAIEAVIATYRDVLAVEWDPVTEMWCEHDRDEDCACTVPETIMAGEWMVIMDWTNLAGKKGTPDVVTHHVPIGMKRSHVLGLMAFAEENV